MTKDPAQAMVLTPPAALVFFMVCVPALRENEGGTVHGNKSTAKIKISTPNLTLVAQCVVHHVTAQFRSWVSAWETLQNIHSTLLSVTRSFIAVYCSIMHPHSTAI